MDAGAEWSLSARTLPPKLLVGRRFASPQLLYLRRKHNQVWPGYPLGERSKSKMLWLASAAAPRAQELGTQSARSSSLEKRRNSSHGSRQHADTNSPVYRVHSRRIKQALADHYSGNPAVIGWQTDNELNTTASTSYSEAAEREFRRWLRDKYVTIEALNFAPRPE